jgi:hypothetical protein
MADRIFVNAVANLLDCPGQAGTLGLAALLQYPQFCYPVRTPQGELPVCSVCDASRINV